MTQLIRLLLPKPSARSTKGAESISTTGFEEEANGAYCQREFAPGPRMSRFTHGISLAHHAHPTSFQLEIRVEELVRTLEKKDHEIRMLQDIVRQLQRGGKPVSHLPSIAHGWFKPCSRGRLFPLASLSTAPRSYR
jgi:hypothetical protein